MAIRLDSSAIIRDIIEQNIFIKLSDSLIDEGMRQRAPYRLEGRHTKYENRGSRSWRSWRDCRCWKSNRKNRFRSPNSAAEVGKFTHSENFKKFMTASKDFLKFLEMEHQADLEDQAWREDARHELARYGITSCTCRNQGICTFCYMTNPA